MPAFGVSVHAVALLRGRFSSVETGIKRSCARNINLLPEGGGREIDMKKISAILLLFSISATLFSAPPAAAADLGVGYTYNFDKNYTVNKNAWREDTTASRWCDYSGGTVTQVTDAVGENTTPCAKFTNSGAHVYFTTLGSDICHKNADGTPRFFKVDFRVYTDGEGLEDVAPGGMWQDPWATPLAVIGASPTLGYADAAQKPIACLEKNTWNEVTYIFRLDNKHTKANGYTYFDTYSDIFVNGKRIAENLKYPDTRSIFTGLTDSNRVKIDFLAKAKSGENFTAYIDDIGLSVHNVSPAPDKPAKTPGKADIGAERAYYIVDEDFTLPCGGTNTQTGEVNLSDYSWELKSGTAKNYDTNIKNYVPLRLFDSDVAGGAFIERSFEPQYSQVRLEYRTAFNTVSADGSGAVALLCGEKESLRVYDAGGVLFCNGTSLNKTVTAGAEYGICAELDMEQKLAAVYVNGEKCAENIALGTNCVDKIRARTTDAFVGEMTFSPVRISRGYSVAEKFVPYRKGQRLPAGGEWTAEGAATVTKFGEHCPWDVYALKLDGGRISRPVATDGRDVLEFRLYSPGQIERLDISLGGFSAYIADGGFYIGTQKIRQLRDNMWHMLRLELDTAVHTVSVRINGKLLAADIAYENGTGSELAFAAIGTVYIDDIMLSPAPEPDEFYPAEPAESTERDVKVGVQVCDLWREGKHYGWKPIEKYPARMPVMGTYDDGSIEAKDWELKYMAENGIDFAIYTWFAPSGVNGSIKEPRFVANSLEAYFNSRYKSSVKMAIMWENSAYRSYKSTAAERGAECLAHFKNVLVPYWIEYYFSDPDYLMLDGKIVFSVYKLDPMVAAFGEENTRAALEYLRAAVKSELGRDMYLLACIDSETRGSMHASSWTTYNNMTDCKSFGFDATYFYGYPEGGATFGRQYNKIMALEANEGVLAAAATKNIPTVSAGRDSEAWTGIRGRLLTPAAFGGLLEKVKTEYLSGSGENALDKLLVLDNWNEYGEGHYIAPTRVAGFGYLDAVAQTFGAPEHTNEKPRYPGRLGHLYSGTCGGRAARWSDSFTEVVRWDFDASAEGWTNSGLTSLRQSDGAVSGRGQYIISPALSLTLAGDEVVHVRARNGSTGTATTRLEFKTQSAPDFGERVEVYNQPLGMKAGEWVDIYYDMSELTGGTPAASGWRAGEVLTTVRIAPHGDDKYSAYAYDYIEILRAKDTPPAEEKFSVSAEFDAGRGAVYRVTNPDYKIACTAWLAEYDGDRLERVTLAERRELAVGKYEFTIPAAPAAGRVYRFGLWDSDMTPLVPRGEYTAK